jgi:triosephosphate isomerase (TIM)
MDRQGYIIANWKMNANPKFAVDFLEEFKNQLPVKEKHKNIIFCPPYPIIRDFSDAGFYYGAQDCHAQDKGAYTGDVSASLLKDIGCKYVIVGHSERRSAYRLTNQQVAAKADIAIKFNLTPIICIGETLQQREDKIYIEVLSEQIKESLPENATAENSIIAYEPVWSIGTGIVPTNDEVKEVFALIDSLLVAKAVNSIEKKLPIVYGGSVNEKNCSELSKINNLNGYLIGSASLDPKKFIKIIESL